LIVLSGKIWSPAFSKKYILITVAKLMQQQLTINLPEKKYQNDAMDILSAFPPQW
jgi:hypothetical protein